MSTATLVSVAEYLATTYRPDRDYLDGVLEERNLGEWAHSRTQLRLASYLYRREAEFGIRVVTEQRVQVNPTRFRIPDVCAILDSDPIEPILRNPPFLCVEIVSREDTVTKMESRIADYFAMGVRFVWVIDPLARRAFLYTKDQRREVLDGMLRTQEPDIRVPLAEVLNLG